MDLVGCYKKFKQSRDIKKVRQYIELSKNSYYDAGFHVDLRHPKEGKRYLKVGDSCMIGGLFVFETETGEVLIGDRCHIGRSTFICRSGIHIGNDVTIAWGCTLYDHNSHSVSWNERKNDTVREYSDMQIYGDPIKNKDWDCVKTKPIVIKDKAWIGMNVIILQGVTIGEGAVVGAGSVVSRDVDDWTVVGGNPARVIKVLPGE